MLCDVHASGTANLRRRSLAGSLLRGLLRAGLCTYRAGFEPIRDLPSLASSPPPLFFPNAAPHPSSSHFGNNGSSASLNNSASPLASSNSTVMSTGMKHSPSASQQFDSSYSNSSGSARGRTSYAPHASRASSVSGSSYASASSAGSYASAQSGPGEIAANAGTTWAKKKWFSLSLPNALSGTKAWTSDTGWGCMLRTGRVCWRWRWGVGVSGFFVFCAGFILLSRQRPGFLRARSPWVRTGRRWRRGAGRCWGRRRTSTRSFAFLGGFAVVFVRAVFASAAANFLSQKGRKGTFAFFSLVFVCVDCVRGCGCIVPVCARLRRAPRRRFTVGVSQSHLLFYFLYFIFLDILRPPARRPWGLTLRGGWWGVRRRWYAGSVRVDVTFILRFVESVGSGREMGVREIRPTSRRLCPEIAACRSCVLATPCPTCLRTSALPALLFTFFLPVRSGPGGRFGSRCGTDGA
ncbi:hypothetical protein B0H16DRAFT_581471 [Mycena metata]|uniref:Cysteine protease n=1 Tax=Mycena metata TaxID=1033252 RepID=A0AAD7H566_9AGAR|nr:hypothetical protein B0H16DRAFT_581471 [Mycena metata]